MKSIEAKKAIDELNQLKYQFKTGQLTYDKVRELGEPHIDTFNKYARALAKARGVNCKLVSLTGFLR